MSDVDINRFLAHWIKAKNAASISILLRKNAL